MLMIAVDPGVTSGFVVFRQANGEVFDAGAYDSVNLSLRMQHWLQSERPVTKVVYEKFMLYAGKVGASKSFSDLPEVRIIGSIQTLCDMYGLPRNEIYQVPAGVYKPSTVNWLPTDLRVRGTHMKDAWRLGMWFLINRLDAEVPLTLKDGRTFIVSKSGGRELTT